MAVCCIGRNVITKEERTLNLPEACHLRPIADDMACAHPSYQQRSTAGLTIADAENAWFVRVDHIHSYGTAPNLERLCIDPPEPLIFLNHYIVPGGTCLTWEHVEDAPGKLCPNPRVILPRRMLEDIAADRGQWMCVALACAARQRIATASSTGFSR